MFSRSSFVRTVGAFVTGVALSLTVVACGGSPVSVDPHSKFRASLIGKPAPEFTAETISGEGPKTVREAIGKVTIIEFWATFCEPCKQSFPTYQRLFDKFDGDLAVLAVSMDDADLERSKIEHFVARAGAKFAVVWDKKYHAAVAYRPALPTAFILDKAGIVRHVHVGYHESNEGTIAAEVQALIEE